MRYAKEEHKLSIRQACVLFSLSTSVFYYEPEQKNDHEIRERLRELAEVHTRWGFWMMHHHLRNLGYKWNHKRVYRIYTEMRLNLRRKYKKRLPARVKEPIVRPIYPNITWSMDFMHDTLSEGSKFRAFNIVDDFNREVLNITLERSITSKRVIRELRKLINWRGKPERIRVDNGPEFIANVMEQWCNENEIELIFIEKGKPSQNGIIERFNRTFREDVLDQFEFINLDQARTYAYAWMWMYNNERPHKSLLYNTPAQFLLKYGKVDDFPTFQQDNNNNWKSLIKSVSN